MTWTCTVSVSFSPQKSKSCQIHVTFMAVSWHFHIQALPGYSLPKSIGKVIQKVGVGCRFAFFCLISASFLAICQIHVGFMALSWHFHGAFMALSSLWFLLFFQTVSWHLHVRFMADSSWIHRGFMPVSFSPQKSKSCQVHVTFMAVSWHFHIQALPGYSLPKSIGKSYPKSRCWLSIWFFLPNFSFIFGNMSDSCRFHGPFMALSWHFLPSDVYCFFLKKIQTNNWIHLNSDRLASMSDSSQIHRGFMALSCHFHGTFLSAPQLCRIHRGFMSLSWQFHGTFTYKPYLGTVCQNLLEKVIQKVGVGCRCVFFA